MRINDWSSDGCSSELKAELVAAAAVDVEGTEPLSIDERGILRIEIGPVLRGGSRNQPERRLVHVRRDLIIDAEDVLVLLEGEHNLVPLPAVPAERRQRVDAIVGQLAEALTCLGAIDVGLGRALHVAEAIGRATV